MKVKKFLSLFLASLMLMGTFVISIPVSAELNFSDTDGHWGEDAIKYVVDAGLMNGVGDGSSFAPDMSLTRGMVVTVLYRDNGSPKANFKGTFLDITEEAYYTAAAEWAYANGIVNGTGTNEWGDPYFSPDRDITRQELATMFKRYADFKAVDTAKKSADISSFPDASSVADWANDAVKWAVGVNLITGKSSNGGAATLSPTDKAVRAEFATIIKRFKEAQFDYHLVYNEPVLISSYTEQPYPLVNDADVYVAVDGNDTNPGTLEKPLATFEAAKLKVRELKKTAKDEIIVAFKAGNYGKLDNVTLSAEDSGTEKVPVTYCKYGDGDVVFENGATFKESDFAPVSEDKISLFPAEAVSKIKQVSIEGLYDGELTVANHVFSEESGIMYRAQHQNRNSANQNTYYSRKVAGVGAGENDYWQPYLKLLDPLPGIIKSFSTLEGLMIQGMFIRGYTFELIEITGFDEENNYIEFDAKNWVDLKPDTTESDMFYGFATSERTQTKVLFCNLAEFLDYPGEYWIDKSTDTLYVYNPKGNYTFAAGGSMITLDEDADHISFIGLSFNGCADTMINGKADFITFDRCTFSNIGGFYAVRFEDTTDFKFINSEVYYFVCSAVYTDFDTDANNLTPDNSVIRNNSFHDFGLNEYWSLALRIRNGIGTLIEHNEIRNGVHGGIRYDYCIDMIIQYNVFDSLMRQAEDFGALYTYDSCVFRGNTVRYNLFKNITGEYKNYGSGYGFYVDDDSCGQLIYGNIFYNGGVTAIMLHNGRDNEVHDNIVISVETVANLSSTQTLLGYTGGMSGQVDEEGNIKEGYQNAKFYQLLFGSGSHLYPKEGEEGYEKWYARWPIIYQYHDDPERLDDVASIFSPINYIKNNAVIGDQIISTKIELDKIYNEYAVKENNIEYSIDENPFFVNPATGDYRIREDADFMKIPYEQIGRY